LLAFFLPGVASAAQNPLVSITSPATGTIYSSPQSVTITASASDNVGVTRVEFYDGTTLKSTDTSAPYSYVWSFTSANNGVHAWTCKAYDASGKSTTSTVISLTVSILADTTAPAITPNVAGTLGANGWYKSNVAVTWTVVDPESPVTSTTGCGSTTISTDTTGVTLTCTATSAGGTASKSVTIKRDTRAPRIVGLPAPHRCELSPANNKLVKVATVTAQDLVSGLAGAVALAVRSNQPGSGDWVIGADGSIRLRAERNGHGKDRVYTITARATDAAGNSTTRTATCVVPHDRHGHGHDDHGHHHHKDKDR
jgi:hypothetical protein